MREERGHVGAKHPLKCGLAAISQRVPVGLKMVGIKLAQSFNCFTPFATLPATARTASIMAPCVLSLYTVTGAKSRTYGAKWSL